MEDNIEVVPSEETGNLPVEAPSEQPKEQAPAVEEPAQPAAAEPELFETPDGRKVSAADLQKEWKENFLPEFTRKSQELAQLKNGNLPTNTVEKPYEKPDWQPQTYDELLKVAEEKVLTTLQQREQQKAEQQKALEDSVNSQLTELKTADPKLNENALFLHANKYGFRDLKAAYQNMKDMSEMVKKVQTTTAQNIAKRNDPVSVQPGATGQRPDPSQFASAIDYLRSLK
jgi:hypothetical protein